ncbi:MAG: type II toxin-antitoxin system RelE/ParE family toxin [Candidatus Aminicenantes bacterium]|nr:type II toxin-antitoxin system RelE/ParE family toxin [Candidatus Aminicenantes bacterium]
MAWSIEIDAGAKKDLAKLDKQVAQRVISFLRDRLQKMADPRSIGEALKGKKFGELWKYRVGDFRIIAKIEDKRLIILVVRVGHRKDIYKK